MKTKLSTFVVSLILIMSQQLTIAQETQEKKAHELYLYGNLHELTLNGIAYKAELKKGTFFRIGATNLNLRNYSSSNDGINPSQHFSFGGGFQAGLEKRVTLNERFSAFYGIDLNTYLDYLESKPRNPENPYNSRSLEFTPGISFGSGFILNVVKNLSLALNVEPVMQLQFTSEETTYPTYTDKTNSSVFQIHLDIDDIKLALVYRW